MSSALRAWSTWTRLSGLDTIEVSADVIRIGALAKMSKVADHADIKEVAPVLSESLWRATSAQLRNMASIGGNLVQRTRCTYFRDPGAYSNCNKRNPGSGCAALEGVNRNHAVLGTSDACNASWTANLAPLAHAKAPETAECFQIRDCQNHKYAHAVLALCSVAKGDVWFQKGTKLISATDMRREAADAVPVTLPQIWLQPYHSGGSMLTLWLIERSAMIEAGKGR